MSERWTTTQARRQVGRASMILEVGANNGTDSNQLLAAFPSATLHCFEPEPRASDAWRTRVRSPRAHLHEFAVAAGVGTTTFHRSGGWPPGVANPDGAVWNESGSIRPPTGHRERWPWVEFPDAIEVATTSLDAWTAANGIEHIDLIWADVQGAEGDLVAGGAYTLALTRYLYIETSETEYYAGQVSTTDLLRSLPGWVVVRRFPDDILLRNTAYTGRPRRWWQRR